MFVVKLKLRKNAEKFENVFDVTVGTFAFTDGHGFDSWADQM